MRRRSIVRGLVAGTAVGLAGCITRDGEEEPNGEDTPEEEPIEDDGTLRIGTYTSMLVGEQSAGTWLTEAFEEAYPDAELEWTVPESGLEHYIQRARYNAEIDADLFLGVTPADLVQVDTTLVSRLFASLDRTTLERDARVRDDLEFADPDDRVIPINTGYLSLVYDEQALETPETFEDLLAEPYANTLLAQNPRRSIPGRAFLLWTVAEFGEDATDYWESLADNGVDVRETWTDAYVDAYLEGERSMIVSYSTDRVGAVAADRNLDRHQVATLEETGYRTTEGIALFEASTNRELAYEFVDFLLSREVQAELATRNVQFPAVADEYVDLDDQFENYAIEPAESVSMDYADLESDLGTWLAEWDSVIDG